MSKITNKIEENNYNELNINEEIKSNDINFDHEENPNSVNTNSVKMKSEFKNSNKTKKETITNLKEINTIENELFELL